MTIWLELHIRGVPAAFNLERVEVITYDSVNQSTEIRTGSRTLLVDESYEQVQKMIASTLRAHQ